VTVPTVLGVFAHPDDETLGAGPLLAHCVARGARVELLVATRGERGWRGPEVDDPGPAAVGRLREAEARSAATILGVARIGFLGLFDGEVAAAPAARAAARIAATLRGTRPDVVVTFGPDGLTGHPDHVAVSRLTSAAMILAATDGDGGPAHLVPKAYQLIETRERVADLERAFGRPFGYRGRTVGGWEPWSVTLRIDTREHVDTVRRAAHRHASQLATTLSPRVDDDAWHLLFGEQTLQRVHALTDAPCGERERDLFEGLAVP
jgi:LmbE family N-acetylglucosaminyl deacetylase